MTSEQDLPTRAEMLDDTDDLAAGLAEVLAGAARAGADPRAVESLITAIGILQPGAAPPYDAGTRHDRDRGGGYSSDAEMLEAVSEAENDIAQRLRQVQQLREQADAALDDALAALDDARKALAAAHALPVKDECDGCHGIKQAAITAAEAAIASAQEGIKTCEAAAGILGPLAQRMAAALGKLRQVPQDLGEVYELVYAFIRRGGKLPSCARWIEGGSRP